MKAWVMQTMFDDYQTVFWKTDRHNRIHILHFQVGDNQNLPANEGRLYAAMNHEKPSGGFEKGEKKGWGDSKTPSGWEKGKKKGWHGEKTPPGFVVGTETETEAETTKTE